MPRRMPRISSLGTMKLMCPQGVRTNRSRSPLVSGQPPVLIRNSEIMDQLYLMGDEFKEFHSTMRTFNARLSAVEKGLEDPRKLIRKGEIGRRVVVQGRSLSGRLSQIGEIRSRNSDLGW